MSKILRCAFASTVLLFTVLLVAAPSFALGQCNIKVLEKDSSTVSETSELYLTAKTPKRYSSLSLNLQMISTVGTSKAYLVLKYVGPTNEVMPKKVIIKMKTDSIIVEAIQSTEISKTDNRKLVITTLRVQLAFLKVTFLEKNLIEEIILWSSAPNHSVIVPVNEPKLFKQQLNCLLKGFNR